MRALLFPLVALAVAGCAPPQSAAEACRRQSAGNRFARGLNRQNSYVANSLEDSRCDAIEREERADAREHRAASEKASARTRAMHAELDAKLAEIRRAPSVPELGATIAEVKVTCERQRGAFTFADGIFRCRIGGPLAFAGLAEDSRVVRTDGYFEGADLARVRERVSESMGPSTGESVSPEGFRVFAWRAESRIVFVTMYAKGVRVSVAQ